LNIVKITNIRCAEVVLCVFVAPKAQGKSINQDHSGVKRNETPLLWHSWTIFDWLEINTFLKESQRIFKIKRYHFFTSENYCLILEKGIIHPWAKQERSLEILYRDLFKNAWHPVSVRLSPHSPPTPVKLEAWKLACIILPVYL